MALLFIIYNDAKGTGSLHAAFNKAFTVSKKKDRARNRFLDGPVAFPMWRKGSK
jgi:hypothetical protein